MVTEPAIVCVPVGLAVTVPAIVTVLPIVTVPLIAGSDAIVTLFDIDAVTEPIWAVPATRAGSVVSDTGCVPWKKVPLTGTVPLMLAVTLGLAPTGTWAVEPDPAAPDASKARMTRWLSGRP